MSEAICIPMGYWCIFFAFNISHIFPKVFSSFDSYGSGMLNFVINFGLITLLWVIQFCILLSIRYNRSYFGRNAYISHNILWVHIFSKLPRRKGICQTFYSYSACKWAPKEALLETWSKRLSTTKSSPQEFLEEHISTCSTFLINESGCGGTYVWIKMIWEPSLSQQWVLHHPIPKSFLGHTHKHCLMFSLILS